MDLTTRDNLLATPAMSGKQDGSLEKASSMAHAAVDSIAETADEAARKANPAIEHAAAVAHRSVDKAAGAAAPVAHWLSAKGERLNAAQKKVVADTSNYVAEHPLKSIGIAVGAGFLLSRLSRILFK